MFLSKGRNGVYYLYFTNPLTNKRTKISTKARFKAEALKFSREFNINKRKEEKPVIYYLSNLQNDVLEYAKSNFERKTIYEYYNSFDKFIKIIGNIPIQAVTLKEIEKFKQERLKVVTPATVNKDLSTLRSGFYYALKLKLINDNPFKNVKKINIPERERLNFSNEEINLLLSLIDNKDLSSIVEFALNSGMRLNEIINLQWGDVDFTNETITIKNKITFKTKTGKIRVIPLTKKLKEILLNITNIKNGVTSINLINSNDYIFKNYQGYKYSSSYITHLFKKFLRKAGLPEKYHFHCLRHTYITNMIKAGVNINFVKELAGHSEIKTTMLYTHINIEDLKQALKNF